MKYCIDFYGQEIDFLNKADEINIELSKIKDLEDLEEFCNRHKKQRINLCIDNYEEAMNNNNLYLAFDFQEKYTDFSIYIRLPQYNETYVESLKKKYPKSKIFYNTQLNNWDILLGYLSYNPTDVYITEALGFEIDKVAEIVHAKNIQIRVFPNVSQTIYYTTPDIKTFWIRPEDTEYYEKYIDIYEFFGEYNRQQIYYDIYAIDKKWSGNLGEIIIGMEDYINSMCLLPRFAKARIKCNRKCLKGEPCQLCDVIWELSKNLESKNLRITINDKKEEKEEEKNG